MSKKVIIVIVEGNSDEALLIERLKSLYKDNEIRFEIQFGDIFYDSKIKDSPKKVIGTVVKKIIDRRKYLPKDILAIAHITDTDGCFIDQNHVIVSQSIGKKTHYTLIDILVDDNKQQNRIITRNQEKSRNIKTMHSIDKIVSKRYPYQLFYFSRNLEHVVFDEPNPNETGKEEEVELFLSSLEQPIEEFLTPFLPTLTSNIYANQYKESWQFIETGLNSLNRYSNVSLLFRFIDEML